LILIVDDEEALAQVICEEIRYNGYDAEYTISVDEAFQILDTNVNIDIILTDVRMPQRKGTDLINQDRCPVVLMSGFTDVTRDQALKLGALDLLQKPFLAEDFIKIYDQIRNK